MSGIGIVGTGISGLHLALHLQRHGVDTTLYAERAPDAVRAGRLPNLVCRFDHTRARERQLGVDHWPLPGFEATCAYLDVRGGPPLAFRGDLRRPASWVDFRLYLAQLLEDYAGRGGRVVVGPLDLPAVAALGDRHDLVVVANGRGSLDPLFPRDAARSPYTAPQRIMCAGLFRGIGFPDPVGLTVTLSPAGEVYQSPFWSFEGEVSGILFASVPGGPMQAMAHARYEDDPKAFDALALRLLREHAPAVADRIEPLAFGLTGPADLLQGGVTPTVRRGWAGLGHGTFAVAIGDAWITNDPITGQGANLGAHCAAVLARWIVEDLAYDEEFCRGVEQEMWSFARPVTEWTNAALRPPPPHVLGVLAAAADDQAVADAFIDGYNDPAAMWRALATPARAEAFLARTRTRTPALA